MIKKNTTCDRCGKTFSSPQNLRKHENRKFPCHPQTQADQETHIQSQPVQLVESDLISFDENLLMPTTQSSNRQPIDLLSGDIPETVEGQQKPKTITVDQLTKWLENKKVKSKKFQSEYKQGWFAKTCETPSGNIYFEECEVMDPKRPHKNFQSMTVWQAIVPSVKNPDYEFNVRVDNPQKYAEAPYMPHLIASAREEITNVLKTELNRKDQIKSAIVVLCTYMFIQKEEGKPPRHIYYQHYHRGKMGVLLSTNDIDEHISNSSAKIDEEIESELSRGSGQILIRIEMVIIESYTYRRAEGGSYLPTPKKLSNKKCTINPDNSGTGDDMCLKYALGAYFANKNGVTKNLQRLSVLEPYLNIIDLNNIPMPTPICSRVFNKIEEQNPNISINVWEWKEESETPKPVIASKNFYKPNSEVKRPNIIHLMALSDTTKTDGKYGIKNHFLWIKNPNSLVFKDTTHKCKKYLCNRCFQSWTSEKSLAHHQKWCFGLGEAPQKIIMPIKYFNDFEKFKNHPRMMNAPCVITADFESDNKECNETYGGKIRKIAEQKANSFCYTVYWMDSNELWGPFLYRGPNATEEFVKRIDYELKKINEIFAVKTPRIITDEYQKQFDNATKCWICDKGFFIDENKIRTLNKKISILRERIEKEFIDKDTEEYKKIQKTITNLQNDIKSEENKNNKVWDHCHMTGKFRGASHSGCNLKLQITPWKTPVPIVFHNFRGYDSHLVCESVGKSVNAKHIKVIAETFERYKSMQVGQLKYIDSLQFMNASLSKLAENLGAVKCKNVNCKHFHRIDENRCFGTHENHKITKMVYKNMSPHKLALLCRKGIYPYKYIDSFERFKEMELPPIHEFNSELSGKISQNDYNHAQNVWKEFDCKNLGDYHDLYLKTDVLVLTDIWTKFRETSMKYYKLDPSHYVSAPALSWDAMLKMTGVKIELFTECSMHDFIEKAKRGGIAMAGHRYFKANNPKMGKDFDPTKPTSWISYVDANNLYGWAMSQFLPIGSYKWVASREYLRNSPGEQKKLLQKILKTTPDSPVGYFLNIKAHFPVHNHEYLNDLPPAVDNIAVKKSWLSPKNKILVEKLDGNRFSETKKLVPHLGIRDDYVIHYQELQYYIKLGMVVDEVSEIMSFKQTNWLAPYIDFNTKLRQKAENDFEKDFFKLMNNSVYGKTMENVKKYQDVKIMSVQSDSDEKKFRKKIRKPSFQYARQFSDSLVGAHMGKASVCLNKPIIVGASVLGLSKLLMYRFWYGFVKEKYGDKAKLGYMDTDSFIFQTETPDIYKDMGERPDIFDLNDSKTIGLMKDECSGNVIKESFHIRAKLYHYVLVDSKIHSRHKGVSKSGMNEMASNTYFPTLGGTLLDDPVPEKEIFNPITQVYRDCLFGNEVFYAKNIGFRTHDHIISLVESEKKALCPIDTKRWTLSDGISSLAYDHWKIRLYNKMVASGIPEEEAEKRCLRAIIKPR